MPLNVSVISPEKTMFEGSVDSVVAPAYDGEVGILPGHAPMMTLLGKGTLKLGPDGKAGRFSVEGEMAGLSVGSSGSTFEAEGSVRIHVSDRLAAMGGYRYLNAEGKDGRNQVKMKLSGWQFGLELSL